MLTRIRQLAAKIETTTGTAESLSGTDGAFNAFDISLQPGWGMTARPGQGNTGHLASVPEELIGTVSFKTEIQGNGSGGVPSWASTFLPAAGFVNSGGTFTATLERAGSNVKTLTIGQYEGPGRRKLLRGCAGNGKLVSPTGRRAVIEWNFTGVWTDPTDVSMITPTVPSVLPLRASNVDFSVGSWSPKIEMFELDFGNSIGPRHDCTVSDGSGVHAAAITDRLPVGKINPEATLVATDDHYTDWLNSVAKSLTYELSNATDVITFASSGGFQFTNIQDADRGGNQIDDCTFQILDEDLTITFAAPA
jgi:hypothetical protein